MPDELDANTRLAVERTRLAHERTRELCRHSSDPARAPEHSQRGYWYSPAAHTTYRLTVTPDATVANVYSIFGTPSGGAMRLPAAYQCAEPFGANMGGTNPALWPSANSAETPGAKSKPKSNICSRPSVRTGAFHLGNLPQLELCIAKSNAAR